MLTEETIVDRIELVENVVQIRHKNSIIKDEVEIASSFNREVITKDSDISHLDKKTQAICKLWLKG